MKRYWLFSFLALIAASPVKAADTDFNADMLEAYRYLLKERSGRGYDRGKFFTQPLNYGPKEKVILGKGSPLTMCNAAVTETLIEAINIRAKRTGWSPETAIPLSAWNEGGFGNLKAQLFSHDFTDYGKLGEYKRKQQAEKKAFVIPAYLRTDIDKLHSQAGMAIALERTGLGKTISFSEAKAGDILSFDRANDLLSGGTTNGGHAVVFLGFLNRAQQLTNSYDPDQVVGFKYFSSQTATDGLGEQWAYFKGWCPRQTGYALPTEKGKAGCLDRIDNAANRAKNSPIQDPAHSTDCCLIRHSVKVGRISQPARWRYLAVRQTLLGQEAKLYKDVAQWAKSLESTNLRLALIAKGSQALAQSAPGLVNSYASRMKRDFGIDLQAIAAGGPPPVLTTKDINRITNQTPRAIINAANRSVTAAIRADIETRTQEAADAAVAAFKADTVVGVPNPRWDSPSLY